MGVQKVSGGRQNGNKGRQINVRWWGAQKLQGAQKAYKKNQQQKIGDLFLFVLKTEKNYFVGAPFEFSGRATFKLVTPPGLATMF